MEEIAMKIADYHRLAVLSLAGAVFFLAVAAVLFIRLNIREAVGFLTGSRARKEIRKREDDAGKTAVLSREMRRRLRTAFIFMVAGAGIISADSGMIVHAEQTLAGPELILEAVENDGGMCAADASGACFFKERLTVSFQIRGEESGDGEEVESWRVLRSDGLVIAEVSGEVWPEQITDTIVESGSYEYRLCDGNGRFLDTGIEICARQSDAVPAVEVSLPEAVMVEGEYYFAEDPQIMGNLSGGGLGIARLEYRAGDGYFVPLADFRQPDGRYAADELLCLQESLRQGPLTDEWKDMADGTYRYTFRAVNVIGNTDEQTVVFHVDKTAPDAQIFVSYETDGTGEGQQRDTGILDFAGRIGTVIRKLFGKTKVVFHLYGRDAVPENGDTTALSGIDAEALIRALMPAGDGMDILDVTEEDAVSFTCEGVEYTGMTHISGTLVLPRGLGTADSRLQIREWRDRAGNVLGGTEPVNITGVTVVCLDRVSPVLEADYTGGIIDTGGRIYYRTDALIELRLREERYGEQRDGKGQVTEPGITLTGALGGTADGWKAEADGSGAGTFVRLPLVKGAETVYGFTVQYQDASGNSLSPGTSVFGSMDADYGIFTNYEVVLDDRPPELTDFAVTGDSDRELQQIPVFRNRQDAPDVELSFTIRDHADYWKPENLTLTIRNRTTGEISAQVRGEALVWTDQGELHTAGYSFDGEEEEAVYQAVLEYSDQAGNPLKTDADVTAGGSDGGAYVSGEWILDHRAPVLEVTYNEAVRLVKDGKEDAEGRPPLPGYTAYYAGEITAAITLQENCAVTEMKDGRLVLQDFVLRENGLDVTEKIIWIVHREPSGAGEAKATYTGIYRLPADGDYVLTASYMDAAKNPARAGKEAAGEIQGIWKNGVYESPLLILDTRPPSLTLVYRDGNKTEEGSGGRKYFREEVTLQVILNDQNLRVREFQEVLLEPQTGILAVDSRGKEIGNMPVREVAAGFETDRICRGTLILELPLFADANYTIPIACTDLSGNQAVWADDSGKMAGTPVGRYEELVTVDRTAPAFELKSETVPGSLADAVRYRNFGFWFADRKMTLTITASDDTAGIQTLRFLVTDEAGKETAFTESLKPAADGTCSIVLPLDGKDFKGNIRAEAVDWSGNSREEIRGGIVESAEKHENSGTAVITTLTPPGRTVDGTDYYRSDVKFNLLLQDSYSGLKRFSCVGGSTLLRTMDYAEEAEKAWDGKPVREITYKYTEDLTLEAATNNRNEVLVRADFLDHAGHAGSVEKRYNIDTVPPVITVEYDQNVPANGVYYRTGRTAVVTIRERNFDRRDVEFRITNTDGRMPSVSDWSSSGSGDDTLHTCTVSFEEDGDYTFTAAFQDLAGNRAEYDRVDAFTIDKTPPCLSVTYDNNEFEHEYYYAGGRTAVIDIEEHNFDERLAGIRITADGGPEEAPVISGWTRYGDHNIARAVFREDGIYTFAVEGMDLAENKLPEYETDYFIIDQTAPELEIFDVRNRSANNGEVRPGIRCLDRNWDSKRTFIRLEGYRNGEQEIRGNQSFLENGMEMKMEEFVTDPKMDDLYTLTAEVYDLAGNCSRAQVQFSVNRFGSVYTFDEATRELVGEDGRYYTREAPKLAITEINVDSLEFREITCSLNGRLRTLREGPDFIVKENSREMGWREYTYLLEQHNFEEEGIYRLTIYSEDRASNASDNNTKGKRVEFAVDRTGPSILISGVEDGAQYRERKHPIVLDVQDNLCLTEVQVTMDGTKTIYTEGEAGETDGRLLLYADSAGHWQTMSVTAFDAAGNERNTQTLRFLVSPSLLVQFFLSRPVPHFILAGLLTAGGAGVTAAFWRKRKKGFQKSGRIG